jgi:hypothetical protein
MIQTYDSQDEYVIPYCWKYYKPTKTIKGDKEYFVCHIDKMCNAGMCKLYHTKNDEFFTIFHNDQSHVHNNPRTSNEWGIDEGKKFKIQSLYKSGLTMPRSIMYSLREESLPEPSICQLNNFLAQLKEKRFRKIVQA